MINVLKIHHLRNISSACLDLGPHFNFIHGINGSGKTTLLEALYMLSCGRSFRTRETAPLIQEGATQLTLFAQGEHGFQVSIQKNSHGQTLIKQDNRPCSSTSALAYALPTSIFYADIFEIIDAGAAIRRSVLDWGLFHVKHEYLSLIKTYKRVLKQRNMLLKHERSYSQFYPWDLQLEDLAEKLHQLRLEYYEHWQQEFTTTLSQLTHLQCSLQYFKGWDKKKQNIPLQRALQEHFESDLKKQYTQLGAHQADLIIEHASHKAKQYFSRGQQKIILMALKLSQTRFLEKPCLFLLDDFSAELDNTHQNHLIKYLQNIRGQFIITSTIPHNEIKYPIDNALASQHFIAHEGQIRPV